jgi:predicted kinase
VDVFYDLAFLLMDLWRRKLPRHANAVLNRYLVETGDVEGVALLPLFLACRAAVRAKTSATAAAQAQRDEPRRSELQATTREYLDMAARLLHPPRPRLVAIGGLSGTGKSTLARILAPAIGAAPGAVHLRSDEIRKELAGVPMLQRLGPDWYSAQMSERVYGALVERAAQMLRSGHSVIVDAVYARSSERKRIEQVAIAEAVPFTGIWLEAPEPVLVSRTEQRRNDASDAEPGIVRLQRGLDTGPIEWRRLDASGSASTVLSGAMDMLRVAVGAGL